MCTEMYAICVASVSGLDMYLKFAKIGCLYVLAQSTFSLEQTTFSLVESTFFNLYDFRRISLNFQIRVGRRLLISK